MPPKGQQSRSVAIGGRQQARGNVARDTFGWVSNPENRSVVIAVTFFATGVAFLHSSWSEILLPPL
ncbi:uncharacterized protein RCC_01794 [Ramularia collo-cygni]|uniref:TOM core complex subunit Tom6 n=1 Tax=Ramularia collo-cygni TaxID=112498 RepID=A0A2D3UR70_9PEZI|nr:uncharacterized protein RCC_01794 [Ramularia collo-cygni]CZT15955.1 uncharacterized protein RCC_01794 [Ramularia collo-cygni]